MDFRPSAHVERIREEFCGWLAKNLPEEWRGAAALVSLDETDRVGVMREWQRRLHEGHWLVVHWPESLGGRGLSMLEHWIVQEECLRAEAPPLVNAASLSIVGPTLRAFATGEQQRRYLQKLLSGEEIWCIGFSEPGAGSDLGSVRTRAERRGEAWVVNGQKVWTTYAHLAAFGFFLVRTDAAAKKHRGLSTLILDMKRPGVTIRPLVEITGDRDFNEVFLDNVETPLENLVGGENQGWNVMLTSLAHERGTLNVVDRVRLARDLGRMIAFAREDGPAGSPAAADPVRRDRLAQCWIEMEIVRLFAIRMISDLEQGRTTTDASVLKLFSSEAAQRMYDTGLELLGPRAQLCQGDPRAPFDAAWQHGRLLSFARTIAAGTSEIQRNIIAERILGLPRSG